jgi:hypothetical protein
MLIPASPSRGAARSNLSRTVSQLHVRNLGLCVICALLIENRFGANRVILSVEFCVVLGVRRIFIAVSSLGIDLDSVFVRLDLQVDNLRR